MKRIFVLALSFLLAVENISLATPSNKNKSGKRASSRGHSNGKRASSARRVAARAVSASASSTDSSSSSTTEEEEPKDKTKAECIEAYNSCMDQKTLETLMIYEDLYNDYNDMLTDVYSGMAQPAFRCLYSDEVIEMHTKYYYGSALTAPTGSALSTRKEVTDESIDYQTFLRQNAEEVASKKISAPFLHKDVIKIAQLDKKPLIQKNVDLPIVSYKVTALNPAKSYKENKEYCADPKKNTNLQGCRHISDEVINSWKSKNPNVDKSCEDYRIYLTEKKIESVEATKKFILGLSTKLTNIVDEYNLKVEADRELEELKAKEEEDRRKKQGLQLKGGVAGGSVNDSGGKVSGAIKDGFSGAVAGAAAGGVILGPAGMVGGAVVGATIGVIQNTPIGKAVKKLKFW